jgi:integrative and conjugative element protein (TIGR02256 family)
MQKMKVYYYESVLRLFDSEIQKFGLIETGGVLLGWYDEENIIVAKATGAGPNATHENFYFRADANYIDMIIDMEFANSNGKIIYLGEWHTHPQTNPQPSPVDLNSLEEITESSKSSNLLLILGAIDFSIKEFIERSISIIKFPGNKKYYQLDPVILVDQ